MFSFITKRPLWANVLFALVLVFLIIILFLTSLKWCTSHGKTITIPAVVGMTYANASKLLEEKGFDIEIQDSVYFDSLPPLSVTRQFPEADAVVKKNRTVYLTLNRAVPPTIEMPKLIGLSFRSAEVSLRQYGLKLEDTTYRVDFAKNSVLDQLYNGESIKPGMKIRMGSGISLVLGTGVGGFEFAVPDLFGFSYEEAKTLMQANGLSPGALIVDPDVRDTSAAFVYRQSPERFNDERKFNRIRQGQTIDLWLGVIKPERKVDTTQAVRPPASNADDY
ncbi:MAG TPA: PASTA domain-containing protein [Chitinophagaceae bacterium]|nr:PASTA domain-containing protein [Chitinophagaceae bacterium]